jgi:hypothetical protein
MADAYFFIDPVNGNDSTGTGTLAAPVKTIGKAIGPAGIFANTATSSGTNYCALLPGIYREVVTLGISVPATGPMIIVGDTDGAVQAAAGSTAPKTGLVDWRGWSNDTTPITSGGALFTAATKSYVTLRNLKMHAANGSVSPGVFDLSGAHSGWTFDNCTFVGSRLKPIIGYVASSAVLNFVFDRCRFEGPSGSSLGVDFRMGNAAAEYNMNVLVKNCVFNTVATGLRLVLLGGSGSGFATGLTVQNCKFVNCATGVNVAYTAGTVLATSSYVFASEFEWCGTGLTCGHVSQLAEGNNKLECSTPRVVVAVGSSSYTQGIIAFDMNDHLLSGQRPKPYGTPSLVSSGAGVATFGTIPATDATGRPRPAGFNSNVASLGAFERHDTAGAQGAGANTDAGLGCYIYGSGDQIVHYLVDAASTTISVKCKYDATFGGTTKPQVLLLACPELGVAAQTLTMSAAAGAWETLTFAGFTPTGQGRVRIQFVAKSDAPSGMFYFDTFT